MMNVDTIFSTVFRRRAVPLGLLGLFLVLVGCDSQDLGDSDSQTPTVNQIATEVQALNTFGEALDRVGPANVLDGSGPYTVFIPSNEAFEPGINLEGNTGVLRKVLQHHVVDGGVYVDTLLSVDHGDFSNTVEFDDEEFDGTLQPLAGNALTIGTGDALTVNHATITNADVSAEEGIVHVVDGLLADAVDRATLTPQFTIFARLVKEANLEGTLRTAGANDGRTLFAPTNDALLERLDANDNGEIESNEIPSNIDDVLQYHVLDSVFLAADVPESETAVQTLEGSDVTVVRSGDAVTVNPGDEDASVSVPNVEVDNGVIHGIDAVLTP